MSKRKHDDSDSDLADLADLSEPETTKVLSNKTIDPKTIPAKPTGKKAAESKDFELLLYIC